jgi:hypothetical protein
MLMTFPLNKGYLHSHAMPCFNETPSFILVVQIAGVSYFTVQCAGPDENSQAGGICVLRRFEPILFQIVKMTDIQPNPSMLNTTQVPALFNSSLHRPNGTICYGGSK